MSRSSRYGGPAGITNKRGTWTLCGRERLVRKHYEKGSQGRVCTPGVLGKRWPRISDLALGQRQPVGALTPKTRKAWGCSVSPQASSGCHFRLALTGVSIPRSLASFGSGVPTMNCPGFSASLSLHLNGAVLPQRAREFAIWGFQRQHQ